MGGSLFTMPLKGKKAIAFYLILIIFISSFGDGLIKDFIPSYTPRAEAAQATIDSNASPTSTVHTQSGTNSVFIDDQTGYKFFVDAPGYCVYRKTTDGGATWGATTTVDSQTDCIGISIWYDKWTPGSASSSIHIVTMDTSVDDLFYNRLDTSGDTLLKGSSPVDIVTNSGNSVATFTTGGNQTSITRGTDGTIYATALDASDSYVVECTIECQTAANWTETGVNPFGFRDNYAILLPLASGQLMAIFREVTLDDIQSKIWTNATWTATTTIDGNAPDNTTYDVGMAAVVSSTTPDTVYLAYVSSSTALGTDDLVKTRKYSSGTWATTTHVFASTTRGITNVAIGLDTASDDVYVAYSARTTAATSISGNVYWKSATSSMMKWSTEVGPINSAQDDVYGLAINIGSDERIFASWFASSTDDILGDTIANIFPGIHATTSATQTASVRASTTNFYTGGKIVLFENYNQHDVTGITITENGTIDAENALTDIKLLYEMDSASPYDCASVSYDGSESQFGSTDTNGFSGSDGISAFTGTTVTVSTTSALCVYPVMTVLDSAVSSSTIEIVINDPSSDITVTDSVAGPATSVGIASSTIVYNDNPTQVHFHFRNDNGSETTASSATLGTEDTSLSALKQGSSTRLRVEISNEGSSSTPAMQYRLEYAELTTTCSAVSSWTDVGGATDDFDMFNTANLTDGNNTTNISTTTGGVTDANPTFLTPNAGIKDTSSQTADITLSPTQFVELEFSIQASLTVVQGTTYCFRVTNSGSSLTTYSAYPTLTINSDVAVNIATSSQRATSTTPTSNLYIGSAFVITENSSSRNVTGITITENGTIDGQTGLSNIRLKYDLDTTSPYNCAGESYAGSEPQFGATSTAFSGANGTSSFSGSVAISTTSAMCLYTVLDTTASALNGETVDIVMEDPSINFTVSGGGSVSPSITRDMNGSTTLLGAILTQTHYHWRNDNGGEATATSMTNGNEDTAVTNISQITPLRLRIEIANLGTVTSGSTTPRLEYGTKISTCSAVSSWTDVGETGGAFDMYNSSYLVDATNTTNITVPSGGVTDSNTTFITPNSAVKETSSIVATTTLSSTQFLEAEYSIRQTVDAGFDTPYCFRLTSNGTALNTYSVYPELTTSPERDFEIQRDTAIILAGATSTTIVAGANYTAPSASTSAFIRITNIAMTGAGHNTGVVTAQNATNTTAYILNPSNIMNSITFARTGISSSTRVSWEIVEFIGEPGSDNEMIVRSQTILSYISTSSSATGTAASGIVDDADVVVFITGQQNRDTASTNYNSGISTSAWNAASNTPSFRRGDSGSDANTLSYAVVEFTGPNWFVQRSEHTFTATGTTETENITAVNSLSRTFLHVQKRSAAGLNRTDEYGAEVWLSSIGVVSYFLESTARTPSGHTSVAWVIENTQTSSGAMEVNRRSGNTSAGTAPFTLSVPLPVTLSDMTNASIFANARSSVAGTTFPQAQAGIIISSTTAFEIWRSNTGSTLTYRAEIVEWPTAGLAIRQNAYRFYVHNNALDPVDPWPGLEGPLGESTVLSGSDNPLGEGERIRIRMTIQAENATFPAGTKAFRLQFAPLLTTCSAIDEENWRTLGSSGSSTIWRGYNATGTTDGTQLSGDPPTLGDLNLTSVSDVAGTLEEENDTDVNLYAAQAGEDTEYDWIVEQNGASAETYYCFRMIESNGTLLGSYTSTYPQLRTASFTPRSQNWRWYTDELSETPTSTLAAENVAPADIANEEILKLRVTVKEIKNIARDDVRFKLQYSEYGDFSVAHDVVATSSCTSTSTWCYANGGGTDNAKVTTTTLSDADSCVASVGNGCGTHNESPSELTGFRHQASAAAEYSFTIQSAGPRVNRVYYFRLFDLQQGIAVPINTGESYPSLATEGASLVFSMEGLTASTTLEGVTLDVTSTPTSLPFGTVPINTMLEGAHRLTVDTNGTEGYQMLIALDGDLLTNSGAKIQPVSGTNASPSAWNTGCHASSTSCLGYHSGDDILQGGSTRFTADDTYARFSTTTLEEIGYSSQPIASDIFDVVFRIYVRQLQDAGQYTARIRYISVPMF